jgi:tRNA (mo5U34)-methyltransferase
LASEAGTSERREAPDADALRAEAAAIGWYHRIDLGHGVVTDGIEHTQRKLRRLGLPEDLRGRSVLDVGAWDGFYSFEAERRGASRVLATDFFSWGGEGWGTKRGFECARRALGSGVEDLDVDVMDLCPERVGVFDLVLFLGVLYHLRHPLLALEKIFSVTGERLILETHVDLIGLRRPALAFYPGSELNRDPTNWCGPNPPAVEALLRSAGFRRVEVVASYHSFPWRLAVALSAKLRDGAPFRAGMRQDRMVFHAWR